MSSKDLAVDVVAAAMRQGATAAEVMLLEGAEFSAGVRLGKVETIKESASKRLGLRIIWEGRQAGLSTSDLSSEALSQLVSDAIELVKVTSVDDQLCLPNPADFAQEWPDLALYDAQIAQLPAEDKIALAMQAETSARQTDERIVNFENNSFDSVTRKLVLANSLGFAGEYQTSYCGLASTPIAMQDGKMQVDYWYDTKRTLAGLESAESIGHKAAQRALRRLGGRKVKTQSVPVVLEPMVAATILGHILEAVSGDALVRKSSFLLGKLAEKVASDKLTIIDDGRIPGALGSHPFDSDGLPTRRTVVIEKGELKSYLLNTYTAHKLGLKSTGNATRGPSSPPGVSCTNLFMVAGQSTPQEIISSVKNGFYVTDLIGFGVNIVNGDYSRGAAGIWIENGELTYPVEEVTIAGNLKDMLKQIEMIGNDLDFRSRIVAPTIKLESMTVSGD